LDHSATAPPHSLVTLSNLLWLRQTAMFVNLAYPVSYEAVFLVWGLFMGPSCMLYFSALPSRRSCIGQLNFYRVVKKRCKSPNIVNMTMTMTMTTTTTTTTRRDATTTTTASKQLPDKFFSDWNFNLPLFRSDEKCLSCLTLVVETKCCRK